MKAITLTQPWATLVAEGEKQFETRSWWPKHRGLLAIHAAAGLAPVGGERGLRNLLQVEPFASVLRRRLSGYTIDELAAELPRGEIIAFCSLADCRSAVDVATELRRTDTQRDREELAFGDFGPGRAAWLLQDVSMLQEPLPCRGALGLWDVPPAAEQFLRETYPVQIASREANWPSLLETP